MYHYYFFSCDVDTTCPPEQFVHPDTKMKLIVNSTEVGPNPVEVLGECQGEEVVMLSVVCEAVLDGRGRWVEANYTECKIDMSEQLTNLLAVSLCKHFSMGNYIQLIDTSNT